MITSAKLRHALLEWQKNQDVHPTASKSRLISDRPDHSKYFKQKRDSGKNASCCAATGRKLLTMPGVGDTYRFWMNTWNTLPESYQPRVYNNNFPTHKRQIQQADSTIPAIVIGVDTARVDNVIHLHSWHSKVPLEEPEIGCTHPIIPIHTNCTYDENNCGLPGGRGDYEKDGDDSNMRNAIPTASCLRWPTTDLEIYDLGTWYVDRNKGEDGNDMAADEDEEALHLDDGSTQNMED
jgi:hypothetical protein